MTDRDKLINFLDQAKIGYDINTVNNTIYIESHHNKVKGLSEYNSLVFIFCSKYKSLTKIVLE
jgi:hypothetical protein